MTKSQWLQVRMTAEQKELLRERAAAAGTDISSFVVQRTLGPDAPEFDTLVAWMLRTPDEHVPYAEFVDYLNTLPASRGTELAKKPARFDELTALQQNRVCALIEQRCAFWGVAAPVWLLDVPSASEPHFAGDLLSWRPYLLVVSPVVFRRRNLFVERGMTGRLAAITPPATPREAEALAAAFGPVGARASRRRVAEDSPPFGEHLQLKRDQIRRLLDTLDLEITRAGIKAELLLVGGAVMTLVYQAREQTKDVDAIFEPAAPVRAAVARIAAREGLAPDWLNDAVSGFLSPHAEFDPYFEGEALRVFVARADYLLAMKILAMRPEAEYRDADDIRFLCRYLGITTSERALDVVERYYPVSRIQPRIRFGLEELLAGTREV